MTSLPNTSKVLHEPGSGAARARAPVAPSGGLLKNAYDLRQLGLITLYMGVVFTMYFVPAARTLPLLAFACWLSFLNTVVLHNSLHSGPFRSSTLNNAWRMVLRLPVVKPAR